MYALRISPAIANEWVTRCIGDVIPGLADKTISPGAPLVVTSNTLNDIIADCAFYADPKCVDASPGERAAYRALLKQCRLALSVGPMEARA